VFVVGGVLDHAGGTVGFHEAVRSFDVTVTVAHLVLALDVVCVKVFHTVVEMIWLGCSVVVVMVGVVTFVRDGWISEGQVPEQSGKHYQLERSTLRFYRTDNILVRVCITVR